jgi:hypothetical protein
LSLRLKRSVEALVGAALTVALAALMLALFPAVAEAQSTSSIVVRPGDSLWSITSERLGPNTNPEQIANGVERLYALNRDRIGADPNLILVGQKLLLPPVGEPSRGKAPARGTPAREATEPAQARPTGRGGKGEAERRAAGTTVGEAGSKARLAPDPVAKPVGLPAIPAKQLTPKVGSPKVDSPFATESSSPVESFGRTAPWLLSSATSAIVGLFPQDDRLLGRRLLGLGIIVLTLLVAAVMVWKLPMKRAPRRDAEVWGKRSGYYRSATNHIAPFAYHPGSLGESAKEDMHRPGGKPEPRPLTSEWEPSAELKDSLLNMPLKVWTHPQENLAKITYHVEVALEELAWLDQRRELFDTERQLEAALEDLLGELSVMAKAHE